MIASQFLTGFFAASEASIYVCSLANERGNGQPAELAGRGDLSHVDGFVRRHDRAGYGLFFAVNTLQPRQKRRAKETVAEIVGLHTDVDLGEVGATASEVETKLSELLLLPSYVTFSGNGYHAYWLLREALEATPDTIAQVERLLRLLADHVGGDVKVCEIARLMRLPGSHNTKRGAWTEVRVVAKRPNRYDLDELRDWLEDVRPFIARKQAAPNGNPFLDVELPGSGAAVDVEARLAAMRHKGPGDSSIHQTQLVVTAALLNRGCPIDEIVSKVLAATRSAAGDEGARWNWAHEERDIRAMCATWTRKKQSPGRAPELERTSPVTLVEGLDDMHFKPVTFLVPDLIPAEGVTLICSKPKVGKSWLLYDLCLSATADRDLLGGRRPMQGHALYLALEDGWRRLKARRDKLLPMWAGSPRPGSLGLAIEWRRVDQGGLDDIRNWVTGVRANGGQVACVCVDVLKMVRPAGQDRKSAYDRDYEALIGLRALAHELNIALVVAHHVRKLEADDLIDKVSGTHGLTGAADTIIVIERASGGNFVFDVRGRDVEAAQLAARFDRETCRWEILGEAAEVQRTDVHKAIRDAVAEATEPMTPREIAAAANIPQASINTYLYRMVKAGEIAKVARGRYAAATPKPASP